MITLCEKHPLMLPLPFSPPTQPAPPPARKRKKTDIPREGWEDGTPPPHRDFFGEGCDALAVAHLLGRPPLPISLRSILSPILAATFMPPRGRPTLVVLSLVISSSVASFSSAS